MKNTGAKKIKRISISLCFAAALCICLYAVGFSVKADNQATINKYNVVVVLDSSGSMEDTDPDGNRYEAIGLFINLLTERGNNIGGVVFSNGVQLSEDIVSADDQSTKDAFMEKLKSIAPAGWTDTGAGLETAVNMIAEQGDTELPSVILYLSDGNTEMGTDAETEESLQRKADAIQKARENNIQVYSVCLNANQDADVTEMSQIADATGGIFKEITSAADLKDAFNLFYETIYGTSTVQIGDETVPENGVIEKEFSLPAFGVEEVNIIIYGDVDNVQITNPNNAVVDSTTVKSNTYTIVKFSDVQEGNWKLKANGIPGTNVKVNMVYNTDLTVQIGSNADEIGHSVTSDDELEIYANLVSNGETATQDNQYNGYEASLVVMDSYRNVIEDDIQMDVTGGKFSVKRNYEPGTYYFKVILTGNYLSKESEELGAVTVTETAEPEPEPNTAPTPVKDKITKKVYVIPFRDNTFEFDVDGIATDKEDKELHYEIESSSFEEGEDYTFSDNKIELTHYSLSKGAFTIRAYDSMGEYCDVELVITSINVGLVTMIVLAVIALIILIIVGIIVYNNSIISFKGSIEVKTCVNDVEKSDRREGRRGNVKLSKFKVDDLGLRKSTRFQATGKDYIYFIIKPGLYMGNRKIKKVKINGDGSELRLYKKVSNDGQMSDWIAISFVPKVYSSRKQDFFENDSSNSWGNNNGDYGSMQGGGVFNGLDGDYGDANMYGGEPKQSSGNSSWGDPWDGQGNSYDNGDMGTQGSPVNNLSLDQGQEGYGMGYQDNNSETNASGDIWPK